MSISGAGTQGNPWIIHTVDELREKAVIAGAFLQLANDLECKDINWETLTCSSSSRPTIELNNKWFNDVCIKSQNGFIENAILKNGGIGNVHEDSFNVSRTGCKFILKNCAMENIGMYGEIDAFYEQSAVLPYGFIVSPTKITNCNIKIKFNAEIAGRDPHLISNDMGVFTQVNASRLALVRPGAAKAMFYQSERGLITLTDCRIEGNAKAVWNCGNSGANKNVIGNCVIALKSGDTTVRRLCLYPSNYSSTTDTYIYNSVYDGDTAKFFDYSQEAWTLGTEKTNLKAITSEQIIDPDALNSDSVNFEVVKVV